LAVTNVLKIFGITLAILIVPFSVAAQAQNAQYHFQLTATAGPYPTIRGTTDIPEGTKLFVMVLKPHLPDGEQRMARGLSACEDACGFAETRQKRYVDPIVKNGAFVAGPFSFGNQPLKPDSYPVRISVIPQVITDVSLDAMNRPVYVSEIRMPAGINSDQPSPKKENWQSINVPPGMDGTMYAYDKNSIEIVPGPHGEDTSEVELAVVVTRGDRSILGRHTRFSFFCDGSFRFRINGSFPMHIPDVSQEYQLANIACAAAKRF
jgi:hypothetical protein